MSYNNLSLNPEGLLNLTHNGKEVESKPGGNSTASVQWNFLPLLIPMTVFSEMGNLFVIFLVALVRRFRRPANFMLANLSLASVLEMAAIASGVLQKYQPLVTYGPWLCRILPISHTLPIPAEAFTIMCVSLERAKSAVRPLERQRGRSVLQKIGLIWGIALLLELPHSLAWIHDESVPGFLKCLNTKEILGDTRAYILYVIVYFGAVHILTLILMLKELIHVTGLLRFLAGMRETELTEYQACQRKLIRTSVFFALTFLLLKLPANFIFLISRMPPNVFPTVVSDWASYWKNFAYPVGMLNSSIYPVVIFIVSNEMKAHCCGKFRCCCQGAGNAGQ